MMSEYIAPNDSRLSHWKLKDFEWHRLVTTGELPVYDAKTGERLVHRGTVAYREVSEEEIAFYETECWEGGKTEADQLSPGFTGWVLCSLKT